MSKPVAAPKQQQPKKVKVMILKPIGPYAPGAEVEVLETEAKYLCEVRSRKIGNDLIKWQNAMPVEDYQKLKDIDPVKGGLTIEEMRALGKKNIVQTPPGPILPEGKIKANQAEFATIKDPTEGASAQLAAELNAKNDNGEKAQ